MDRSRAQAFQGGGRAAASSLIPLGRDVTRRKIKRAAHGQKIPAFFLSSSPLAAPRPPRPPFQCQQKWGWNVAAGKRLLHLKGATPEQIVLSVITSAIFRETQLIVSLLVPFQPDGSPAERSLATRTCHWIKTIKLQRAPLQRLRFDEGTIIQPIAASRAPQG